MTSPSSDDSTRVNKHQGDALTGTTLRIYRYLITQDKPVGPRELQRALNLSSPSLAIFHLDKLLKAELVQKNADGTFFVDKTHLKHYVRLRRYLIPRYLFYAVLTTLFLLGWLVILLLPNRLPGGSFWTVLSSPNSFILTMTYIYGLVITLMLCGVFWFETMKVWRNEVI